MENIEKPAENAELSPNPNCLGHKMYQKHLEGISKCPVAAAVRRQIYMKGYFDPRIVQFTAENP